MGNPASNTDDCFRECIGHQVKGILIEAESRTLVLDDGRGLTISHNGSYWIASAADLTHAIAKRRQHLRHVEREIQDVIALAGADEKPV